MRRAILIIAILGGLGALIAHFAPANVQRAAAPMSPLDRKREDIGKLVLNSTGLRFTPYHFWEGPFTVRNPLDVGVKDLLITCSFYGQSGTKIDERSVRVFEIIPAKSERRTQKLAIGFVSSQVATYGCGISDMAYSS